MSRNLATVVVRGVLPWAKKEKNWTVAQWSKVLFSDESKFCISFGNQGPRVWRKGGEAHSPSCLKSSVEFPQSVMIWGAMSSAGFGPLCFLKTNVTAPVYQLLRTFNSLSRDGSSNIEIVTSLVTMQVARDKHNRRCQQKIIYFTRIKEK